MKRSWFCFLFFVASIFAVMSCNESNGKANSPVIGFQCQYKVPNDERELLAQARNKAISGESLENLIKHAENCLEDNRG